ncbi:protein kinase domain-containing protein [Nocardioides daejeonensis]|uniref:protein kinase domain-containing protein n=1 Tax=Nocardioides daejeonensis TaxID=1046556 RepID=UPI0013A59DA2|nr:serine/threonine protein kinase [Nocardioides daejeonensis]
MALVNGTPVDLGPLGHAWVTSLIGQGGQGYVYLVQQQTGRQLALKWYRPESASLDQHREIQTLVEFGTPHNRFLWPLSVARVPGDPGFGYVMELRDRRYLELSWLLANRRPDGSPLSVSFAATINLCRQLAFSFLQLHAGGLCYRDISFGNVFFEPDSGDVLICDNDNVGIDNGTGRVLGTPFFMAPEVVADQTFRTLPNTDTDRHSLAVLMFYVLFMGHPLEGALTEGGLRDQPWLLQHFGTDPVFCMDPERTDNRPSAIVQNYWNLYPGFLRELFVEAFGPGLREPSRRVTEGQWIKAMDRLADAMVRCACGTTAFWDASEPARFCRNCGAPVVPAYVVRIGRRRVAVSEVAAIRADHLVPGGDDPQALATFHRHPQDPYRWGVCNRTGQTWTATYPGGSSVTLGPGMTTDLTDGLMLQTPAGPIQVARG